MQEQTFHAGMGWMVPPNYGSFGAKFYAGSLPHTTLVSQMKAGAGPSLRCKLISLQGNESKRLLIRQHSDCLYGKSGLAYRETGRFPGGPLPSEAYWAPAKPPLVSSVLNHWINLDKLNAQIAKTSAVILLLAFSIEL